MANDTPKEANDPSDGFVATADADAQRSAALAACERATRAASGGENRAVQDAIQAFEQSLFGGGAMWPSPDGGPLRQKYAAFASNGPWSVGTYLAYDALLADVGDDNQPHAWIAEATPILLVPRELPDGCVCTLHVERRFGPNGLVTPHWRRVGTMRFPGTGDASFFDTVQRALRAALAKSEQSCRLTWWLSRYDGLPSSLDGRSAEASALCAAWAVLQRTGPQSPPLLHPKVAVSALVARHPGHLTEWTLAPLGAGADSVRKKFDAATAAKLLEVVLHAADLALLNAPPSPTEPRLRKAVGVGDAYEMLLETSQILRDVLDRDCNNYRIDWTPRATPDAYVRTFARRQ